jgi:hypothetical protein
MNAARMIKTGIIETGLFNGWDIHIFNDAYAYYNFTVDSPGDRAYVFPYLYGIFDLDIYIIRP